ncbi:MAG: hypothetical protein P4L53_05680 [Candidatus Obscuribacterales bacterium]|nr:hypothetical protein [Candidatus Obscuribacterales bacterium]
MRFQGLYKKAGRVYTVAQSTFLLATVCIPTPVLASDASAVAFARSKTTKPNSTSFRSPEEQAAYTRMQDAGQKAKAAYAQAKAAADTAKPLIQAEQQRAAAAMRAKNAATSAVEAQEAAKLQAENAAKAAGNYQAAQATKANLKKVAASAEAANSKAAVVLRANVNCPKKVKAGSDCHITVTTAPNAECHTTISTGAGANDKKTLPDLTADASGSAEFVFTVPECRRGYLIVNAECTLDGARVVEMKKVDLVEDNYWFKFFTPAH